MKEAADSKQQVPDARWHGKSRNLQDAGGRRRLAACCQRLLFVALLAAFLLLSGCAGDPLEPTPTAVPLVATVAPQLQPTRVASTPTIAKGEPGVTTVVAEAGENGAGTLSATDEALARSTVEDLLARLVRGEVETAARLYLTQEAQASGMETVLLDLADGDAPLAEATLLTLEPVPAAGYRAEVALRRTGDGTEGVETVALLLAYRRGLWLVDEVSPTGTAPEDTEGEPTDESMLQTGTPEPAATPISTPASAAGVRQAPSLSGRVAFQASSGGDIYVVNAGGSNLHRIADGLDPAWSPGGDRIAFTRWRSPWGVYLIRPDGSGEERVVDGNKFKEVAWAPGGRRLAFTLNQGSSGPQEVCFFGYCFTIPAFSLGQIWVANLDTGELVSLPLDDQVVHSPAWDPAGERIVYAGERGLSWIDLDTMGTGVFASSSAWDGSPAFSPDGKHIAFMGRAHDRWEIFAMSEDGSGRRQLTESDPDLEVPGLEEPPHNVAPAWSPDGKQIAFVSNRDGRWRIYVMNADGTRQRPMFSGAADEILIVYDWASERVVSWGPAE